MILFKGVFKSMIYCILCIGQVWVNGKWVKFDICFMVGDMLCILFVCVVECFEMQGLSLGQMVLVVEVVIFEDKYFLVIDKFIGMVSYGGSGVSYGVIELMWVVCLNDYFELVYWLDCDISGVLVFVKICVGLIGLQVVICDNQVVKQYFCLMVGYLFKVWFDVNVLFVKFVFQGGECMVRVFDNGKLFFIFFCEIEQYLGVCLMQVMLGIGCIYQICVYVVYIGYFFVGDLKYGDCEVNKCFCELGLQCLFLYVLYMSFELDGCLYSFLVLFLDDLRKFLEIIVFKGKSVC